MSREDKKRSRMKIVQDALRWFLRKKRPPEPEADPHSYVPAPLRHGPKNRSGAAVAEIEDDSYRSFPPRQ